MLKMSRILFVLLLAINVFLAGFYLNQKQGWHVDEIFSYGHANSTQGAFLTEDVDSFFIDKKTDLHHKWLKGKVFHDYLTTQEDERFRYEHITKNLQKSVHPPLFYYLLHTVCSLMPDEFLPWQAGGINLFFFMLTLVAFYALSKLFLKDEYLAMIAVFLWGFSTAGMATAVFLRMYMLQTFFAVCLIYEVSKMLIENEASKGRLFLIFLYATLGNLTQFSSLVFAFIVTLVSGVILLYRKNFKLWLKFSLMMLLSAVALFAIYPEAYGVLFNSARGEESVSKINDFWAHLSSLWLAVLYSNSPSRMFEIYFVLLFGIKKVADVFLLGLMVVFFFIAYLRKTELSKAFLPLVVMLVLMTIYLSFMMPDMGVYNARYYMLLMPAAALIAVYVATIIFKAFGVHKMWVYCLMGMGIGIVSVFLQSDFKHNAFLVPQTQETITANEALKNKRIVVKTPVSAVYDLFSVLAKADKVYIARENDNILPTLFKADFVLKYNSYATLYTPVGKMKACFFCIPKPKPLLRAERKRLKYVSSYRAGVINFDLYEVNKK